MQIKTSALYLEGNCIFYTSSELKFTPAIEDSNIFDIKRSMYLLINPELLFM